MEKNRLEDLCRRGVEADKHFDEGRSREALKLYTELGRDMEKGGDYDSYLAAKVTLGVLRSYIKLGEFKPAFEIWNADLEQSFYGVGIYALEGAQTTVRDMIIYDMICAFLHTLADSDRQEAVSAVNQYLSRVCEHALEEGDRTTMKLAISNWKQHLRELFGTTIPHAMAQPLIGYEKSLGETALPQPLSFPKASSWEKPRDFLEMSRFVEMKDGKQPASAKQPASGKKSRAG